MRKEQPFLCMDRIKAKPGFHPKEPELLSSF